MKSLLKSLVVGLVVFVIISQLRAQVAFAPAAEYVDNYNAQCVVAADINGDGKMDFITAHANPYFGNTLSVFTNKGNGTFALASTIATSSPQSVTAADFNGDGKVDLACVNVGADTVSIFTNKGTGVFLLSSSPAVGHRPYAITTADVNNDGKMDLITANYNGSSTGNTLSVLTNNGSGGFVLAASPDGAPYSVVAAEVNEDGYVDLISAGAGYLKILTNNTHGDFFASPSPYIYSVQQVVAADANHDGHIDLITGDGSSNAITVLTNDGHGIFTTASTVNTYPDASSLAVADLNGDGFADLIVSSVYGSIYTDNRLNIFTNDGSGGFSLATYLPTSGPASVVAADVNGDSKPDLIAVDEALSRLVVFIGVPTLNFKNSISSQTFFWPSSWTGWSLQQNPDLTTTNWLNSVGVLNDGTNKSFTISTTGEKLFFRLIHP